MKTNLVTFCIFAFLLVFAIVQPALAASDSNKIKTMNTTSSENQTNISVSKSLQKVAGKNQCPCIVFRLDDIQDYFLSDVQMKVIDVFQKKNASLSIGIIGYQFPLDEKLVSYLKTVLKPGRAPIEIANHGWKHENFSSLSLSQQVLLMNKTNQELIKALGKRPQVFITPYNVYNNDTLKAIKQTNMSVISAGGLNGEKFVTIKGNIVANKDSQGLYHVPSMTDFQVYYGNSTAWTSIPKEAVIASIDSHISKYGYDVVLLHPQNFAKMINGQYDNTTDKKFLDELSSIIDYAKSKHIKITTLLDIAELGHTDVKSIKKISQTTSVKPKTASISQYGMTLPSRATPYVEPNGSLTLEAKYFNGDRLGAYTLSFKIYRDFDLTPYKEINSISGNPYTITSLPMYHQYKIKTFVNGMLSSTDIVNLDSQEQDLNVSIPAEGSMLISVYYNDGQTPIAGASVTVRSQDNKTRGTGVTDPDGLTNRFWLASTTAEGDSYIVDAKISKHLTFSFGPLALQPEAKNDFKLIAPWPAVVQNLVTFKVYNQTKLLSSNGKSYAVGMYDSKGNKLVQSPVNIRGESYFWSIKTGDYVFKVANTNSGKILGNLAATLDGTKNNFDLIMQSPTTKPKGDLGKNL